MNQIAEWSSIEREEIFQEAGASLGIKPAIIEKDFWVTWVLNILYSDTVLAKQLMFKGGTTLSKVYGLIERFSEDIDLILDWQCLSAQIPEEHLSKTKDQKMSRQLNKLALQYIESSLLKRIESIVQPICKFSIDSQDPYVLNLHYPVAFSDRYLRPGIRLEIGPMAAWNPHQKHFLSSLAAEVFPDIFKQSGCLVNVILAKRTFWEKATILHAEAHRPQDKKLPLRYSRHYYDLAQMAKAPIKEEALADGDLLQQVVEFKQRFYPSSWAHYSTARIGSFKLIPTTHGLSELSEDYKNMRHMIYGDYPTFKHVITTLDDLEKEINLK